MSRARKQFFSLVCGQFLVVVLSGLQKIELVQGVFIYFFSFPKFLLFMFYTNVLYFL